MASLDVARRVIRHEADALKRVASRLDARFTRAVDRIYRSKGRVVVFGMGKPGFIAQKFSASLASTGTPSIYVHPADALHGDIGRVAARDVVVAFSKSGETEEMVRLLPILKRIGSALIAITGNTDSKLGKAADVSLDCSVLSEAEPLSVAPTTSTACMLALADALTMALVQKRGFQAHDFARLHPGGSIGLVLHLTVRDAMRKGAANPLVRPEQKMKQVLLKITSARAGSATIVDGKGRCAGIFTDGDLRRHFADITRRPSDPVSKYMTRKPVTVREEELAASALDVFKRRQIDELPVTNRAGKVVGLLDVQDLLKQGFIL